MYTQSRVGLWLYGVVTITLAIVFTFAAHTITRAQSGEAGGGGTGGRCTSYCTDNGYGWKKYSVDGEGPRGNSGRGFLMSSPKTWNQVKDICKGYDTESVWIFVAYHEKDGTSIGLDYDKDGDYNKTYYVGDASVSDAKKFYDEALELGIAGTGTLTWGKNIAWFCYSPNLPWNLVTTSTADKQTAEVGSKITWTHTVKNDGDNKTNKVITWHSQDRGVWGTGHGTDWTIAKGLEPGKSKSDTSTYIVQPGDFGKSLCRATSAKPAAHNNSWWTESESDCVLIVKKPKVQVLGSDLLVGRTSVTNAGRVSKVDTSISSMSDGRYFGSWAEYAIIPTGGVSGMASGSAYVSGATTNVLCSLSVLTFANGLAGGNCSNGTVGKFKQDSIVPDIASVYPVTSGTAKLDTSADIRAADLRGVYTSDESKLELTSAGEIEPGRWVVINAPNTTVTISSNIRYSNSLLTNMADIPQVVIIAKNIIIKDSVTAVDSWLIASGTGADNGIINTCGAGAVGEKTALTRGRCANQLVVNGPVFSNHLQLRRTFGSDSVAAMQYGAEVFTLRGDAYLWATSQNREVSTIRTMTTKELPPRY